MSEYSRLMAPGGIYPGASTALGGGVEHRVRVRAFSPPVQLNSEQNEATVSALLANVEEAVKERRRAKRAGSGGDDSAQKLTERMMRSPKLESPSAADIGGAFEPMQTTAAFIRSVLRRGEDKNARVTAAVKDLCAERARVLREAYSDDGVTLERAHTALLGCMAIIDVAANFVNSDNESIDYVNRLVASYLHRNGAPFSWKSSSSLATGSVPCVYETYVPREHCIMLAWRAAMIAVRSAMCIYDPTGDLRSIFELDEEEDQKRRRDATYLIVYALNLLQQVIPAQMRALYGSSSNQYLSPAASAAPEFRPAVLDSIIKLVASLLEQVVLRHTDVQSMKRNADLTWLSASQRYDRYGGQESAVTGERVLCTKLQTCAIEGVAPKMTNSMRSLVFVQCVDALRSLTLNAWTGHLEDTMRDFRIDNHLDEREEHMVRYFGSQTHRVAYTWVRNSVDVSADETDRRDSRGASDAQIAALYNQADSSRALRNLAVGTAIYQECIMMAKELRAIDVTDGSSVARASVLAQKVEILLSPIYGRRRSAFELTAWIVAEMRDRCEMCFEASSALMYNQSVRERGSHMSHMRSFTSTGLQREATHRIMVNTMQREGRSISMESTALQDPYDTNSMQSASGDGVRPAVAISSAANVLFEQFKQRILYGEDGKPDAAASSDEPSYGADADARRKEAELKAREEMLARGVTKTQRIVPLSDDDIDTWEAIVGSYDTRRYGAGVSEGTADLEGRLHTFTSVSPGVWMPNSITDLYAEINTNIIADVATLAEPYYAASPSVKNREKRRPRRRRRK